ncbi:MAG: Peptidase, partial [Myxococcales bacterium]|nr:Peptidase [Myxococcales bacterium]
MALHEGKANVTTSGIELWHPSCWIMRNARPAEMITLDVPQHPPRAIGKIVARVSLSSMVVIMLAQFAWLEHTLPSASLANIEIDVRESLAPRTNGASRELVPLRPMRVDTAQQARYPVPLVDGQPLDELFPSLREWKHPVTNSPELMPEQYGRKFGSPRPTLETIRPECGEGHCGIDLDGPRGRPIVAVADGIVVRVEHSELGLDGRSGRYVRIEHDDGTLTAYMHLDDIADGLQVRDRVQAGQYIGTLGATAVFTAPPHCHFSLEIPNHPGLHGDNTDTHYVDPAPF